jgi:hypothetical protein
MIRGTVACLAFYSGFVRFNIQMSNGYKHRAPTWHKTVAATQLLHKS